MSALSIDFANNCFENIEECFYALDWLGAQSQAELVGVAMSNFGYKPKRKINVPNEAPLSTKVFFLAFNDAIEKRLSK